MKEYNNLSYSDQIELLEKRGMKFDNKERNAEKLKFINYYKLKELAYPFSENTENGIVYRDITFDDLIKRYYQDKNLRMNILHCIEKIEVAFKTQFSHVLGKKYGAYGYLKFNNWMNKEKYCKYYISDKQGEFKEVLKEKVRRTNSINIRAHLKNNQTEKIPIWMLVEELSFGEVIRLYNDMSIENKKVISNTFACLSPELESWLNTLNFIRNRCAHNKNIIDIKIKTKPKLRGEWKDYLIINDNNQTSGHIADTIAPMVFLTTQINNSYNFFIFKGQLSIL